MPVLDIYTLTYKHSTINTWDEDSQKLGSHSNPNRMGVNLNQKTKQLTGQAFPQARYLSSYTHQTLHCCIFQPVTFDYKLYVLLTKIRRTGSLGG